MNVIGNKEDVEMVTISPRLIWQWESNPRPFSVWGKCGEKHFPDRDAENGTWNLGRHCK